MTHPKPHSSFPKDSYHIPDAGIFVQANMTERLPVNEL